MTDDVTDKKMVVGFAFAGPKVLLVRKERPSWQKGLWNGVGGVIEDAETPLQAMVREFQEETGYQTRESEWKHYATEREKFGAWVYFFLTRPAVFTHTWPSANDAGELLSWRAHVDVPTMCCVGQCVGNLEWLIPLARDPRFAAATLFEPTGDIREKTTW